MDWHDSDPSDDDSTPHNLQSAAARKRSSRACDHCRKTKSKCERPQGDGVPCKSCTLAKTACTFLGPSYKRGPPKGYIHAIEQRWHQVESLVGALLQCPDPRVQALVSDLRKDDLAREILGRVDTGPYGPSGRRNQPVGATKEDFFASILKSNESHSSRDPSRSHRQSRVSREIVSSSQDHGLAVVPTQEWQDNLSARLASSHFTAARPSVSLPENSDAPLSQRRRLNIDNGVSSPPDWDNLYTLDQNTDTEEVAKDPTEGIGQLSLDEHSEVRYHGKASGLHLLGRSLRTDDRVQGGIWKLPMARVWPPAKNSAVDVPSDEEFDTLLPPVHVQDHLVDLYFAYVHPVFPVIRKTSFLAEFNARKTGNATLRQPSPDSNSTPRPQLSQEATPLLLLSIFAIAARFSDEEMPLPPNGKMWEAGCNYLDRARDILTKTFHRSRPSTVQSLLLLGYREFGIGSMEQGWIFIGMAIRMAMDLGLNCDSAGWKFHGHDLFSPEETETRRQIWWTCVLADRYGSMYMGRPILIKDGDYDTHLPHIDPEEDNQSWQPITSHHEIPFGPVPERALTTLCAAAKLSVIIGDIVTKIYPVRTIPGKSRWEMLESLERQLDQWFIGLPEGLRYDSTSRRNTPPPQILFLHVRYWGAVLLLQRAFIPNWKGSETVSRNSALELKAFDLAQGAASHVSALVTVYRETFTLKESSPFLTSYLLSAAIMHVLTLTLRPSNLQASLGLRHCMTALKEMEIVWPSAARAYELLNGVKLGAQEPEPGNVERNKRDADDAFGQERPYNRHDPYTMRETEEGQPGEGSVQDWSTRIMAHMLGLNVPGLEPSTSYYPGYEWWPRPPGVQVQAPPYHDQSLPLSPGTSERTTSQSSEEGGGSHWLPPQPMDEYSYSNYNQFTM